MIDVGSVTSQEQDLSCLLHGSAIVRKNKDNLWSLYGLTALIRGRKGGLCRNDTVYFNARLSYSLEWIRRSLRFKPINLSSVFHPHCKISCHKIFFD